MAHPGTRRVLTTALALMACLSGLAGSQIAGAAPARAGAPTGIDASYPTVSGRLVAKPLSVGGSNGRIVCKDQDRTAEAGALMANRGLVICTEEGALVLLQLSPSTRIFNRNWDRLTINQMTNGDHINAWGVLTDHGIVLNPTFVVQDTSKPAANRVSGVLVAKPGSNQPVICKDRDRTAEARTLAANRGLVICTEEGKLVLLQLSPSTKIRARYWTPATVADLTDGDHLVAWGVLRDGGVLLDPTYAVEDTDIQSRYANSQDLITSAGPRLTLFVLKSDALGPVKGVVHADAGPDVQVILCGNKIGRWSNLTGGMTVDITGSIFNRRIMTYVDTEHVTVVSCR